MNTLSGRLLVTLALLLAAGGAHASDFTGSRAPEFTLKTVEGKRVRLSELLADGPVLLDFWATWCQPCKQALPHLDRMYEQYRDRGFTLLAISVDNTRSVSKVRPYVRGQGFEFPVALDTDSEVLRQYRGNNVPHTVLIGADGLVRKVWIGYHPGEEKEIEREVVALLPPAEEGSE
ncbi:MAG: Thiol-disulfide oxidoreductase ResA [Calditrichaeota bacterium]|nr:Thiol-disulfide oxidoreductase ResA [Calditrichota bacterium]